VQTRPSLLARVRDVHDAEAWNTFVALYAPLVYRYLRQRGLQDADAADLTQEVMGAVARAIRSFEYRPERGRFRDWLRTIARRRLARFLHGRSCRPEETRDIEAMEDLEEIEDGSDVEWDEAFSARVLVTALRRIRPCFEPMTWRAFERVWLEDRSAAETARELSIRIDRVYLAKSRVLKRLEKEVQEIVEDFSWLDALERA
jgi:RNA polymerase sigma factor (sigma-70 family)